MGWIYFIVFFTMTGILFYQRASLSVWTVAIITYLIITGIFIHRLAFVIISACVFMLIFGPLYFSSFRRRFITAKILRIYRQVMPSMSRTEREALAAGTVGWEGELFQGNPNWQRFLHFPAPKLTAEEKAFLEGPVETLCNMTNDWDITHNRADLPPEVWQYLKEEGFFGLIIPKSYGGKEFSAYAHAQILIKIYGQSTTLASTVAVPNSLGPAELLLHYGTSEQKEYYLPRLARGEEVPCFALTGPLAGSDAGSMTDTGIVCYGEHEGKKVIGIRLNWDKRYITLAPIATVIGLAFKLYDPDHILGAEENLGITCALIPRETAGITIGRRHFTLNIVFQNGPTQGKEVFIPLDWIIGGPSLIGHGWRMLMECLAAGRAISLPSSAIGGGKVLSYAGGAYARIRRQFNIPIGQFEGIETVLTRIVGNTYIMNATGTFTASIIDAGEKPAVASAITKYHVTELGRQAANDAMDLHGGKGICLGPKNYLGRAYQAVPIAITVEGANILTRSMIIFGQGAMRCHPYIYKEFEAACEQDSGKRLWHFDQLLVKHIAFTISNFFRTFFLSLTNGCIATVPSGKMKKYYQQVTRFSSAFALVADISLLILGGALKRKENLSARLGDILSQLYILSSLLKYHEDQGQPQEDLPLLHWSFLTSLDKLQAAFDELLENFPNRLMAGFLRVMIFPLGKRFYKPNDKLSHTLASLFLEPTSVRARLCQGIYESAGDNNVLNKMNTALHAVILAEPIEKRIRSADIPLHKKGNMLLQAEFAYSTNLINAKELELVKEADQARNAIISVDDFSAEELIKSEQ